MVETKIESIIKKQEEKNKGTKDVKLEVQTHSRLQYLKLQYKKSSINDVIQMLMKEHYKYIQLSAKEKKEVKDGNNINI